MTEKRDQMRIEIGTRNLRAENEVVIPEVPDPPDEAELFVSEGDHGVVAEDDRLLPQLRPRELREDETDHEGLDETADY